MGMDMCTKKWILGDAATQNGDKQQKFERQYHHHTQSITITTFNITAPLHHMSQANQITTGWTDLLHFCPFLFTTSSNHKQADLPNSYMKRET